MKSSFLQPAVRLTTFAAVAIGVLMLIAAITEGKRNREALLQRELILSAAAPHRLPENYVWQSVAFQPADKAGLQAIYPINLAGVYRGAVIEFVVANGYSGAIRLFAGIDVQGKISSVRVIEHRETPGLGDRIERHKSDWLNGFVGLSAASALDVWRLRNPLGESGFDQLTGATVTAKAVLSGVQKTLTELQPHLNQFKKHGVAP